MHNFGAITMRNSSIDSAVLDARTRYIEANPRSASRHEDARRSLPGGNTRSVLWYEPFPVAIVEGEGCSVTDLDGHRYTDFVSEYSAALYGHSNLVIQEAIISAVRKGIALGGPNIFEARLAEVLTERFPALERVRFCNSGTEANIMAISAARALTGRQEVLVFREGYHGGVLTFAHGGSVLNLPFPFIFADYNDVEGTEKLLEAHKDSLAAVILEPMLGGGGCIRASDPFLGMLRAKTTDIGALLIFDEVMTSRLDYGGLQTVTGVTPDLMTLGKYVGGGASFGAFGGRGALMDHFDPSRRDVFSHGGTFNNNILSMAAGLTGLTRVLTKEASARFNALGERLRAGMQNLLDSEGVAGIVCGYGSLMNLHFVSGPVMSPADLHDADERLNQLWHLEMMLAGQYVTPRGMLALSLSHEESHIQRFLEVFGAFLDNNRAILPAVGQHRGAA